MTIIARMAWKRTSSTRIELRHAYNKQNNRTLCGTTVSQPRGWEREIYNIKYITCARCNVMLTKQEHLSKVARIMPDGIGVHYVSQQEWDELDTPNVKDIECPVCEGKKEVDCPDCGGAGGVWDHEWQQYTGCPGCAANKTVPCRYCV